ncbi:MAG TPA: hypothetical protein VN238_00675 [Solirubrobacteraceae bacterium]|nr:hypothetical protein [Solirubrobacteraceae bacterium]
MVFELIAAKPAGGAALDQVAIATVGATVVTALLLWLIHGHRYGHVQLLTRTADFAERRMGLPGWAALPNIIGGASLLTALLGMYWDIALHIGVGRDEGPLANPAHYLILIGLYGIFAAGLLAIALPHKGERPGPAALKISRDWYAPVGGVLMAAAGAFALIGFPLDDMWHRLFGQDVTLWGPTHLMLIGGAGMTLVGAAVLLTEGMRAKAARTGVDPMRQSTKAGALVTLRRASIAGGFLIGLSTFQAEFDFGVPQYAQVLHPFMVALAAGVALTCARVWMGPGGAIFAAVFFLVIRGVVDALTGPALFGETFPVLPLYIAEAVVVEIAAVLMLRRSAMAFGVLSGVLIGTVGFAAEYAWTQVAFKLPWEQDLLPEGVIFALVGGIAGGVVGTLMALGLRGQLPKPSVARTGVVLSGAAVAIAAFVGLQTTVPQGARAQIELTNVTGGADTREGDATVRITPASLVDSTKWVTITSWQGGGLHVDRLEKVGEGVYRTTEPMPLHGDWKTLVRVHAGRDLTASPIYFPADPAIPAPAIAATPRIDRPFSAEIDLLQRERKDAAPWLWAVASAIVLGLYVVFLAALAWGVGRLSRRWDDEIPPPSERAKSASSDEPRFERPPARRPVATGW